MSVVTLRSRRGEQEARRQPALEHPGHGSRGVMGRPQGPGRRLGPSVDARRQAVAFGAALRIAEKWGLTQQQLGVLLGGISRSTISRWSAQWRGNKRISAQLTPETLERIGLMLGIYKSLHTLFPDSAQADGWIRRINSARAFEGGSALDRMLQGGIDELRTVRSYLNG